jgi:hypothetical protein
MFAHGSGGSGGLTHPSSPERAARAMLVVVDLEHRKRDKRPLLPDNPTVPLQSAEDGPASAKGTGKDD